PPAVRGLRGQSVALQNETCSKQSARAPRPRARPCPRQSRRPVCRSELTPRPPPCCLLLQAKAPPPAYRYAPTRRSSEISVPMLAQKAMASEARDDDLHGNKGLR